MKNYITTLMLVLVCGALDLQAQVNLEITSSPNFRELGGLKINDSLRIKTGKLYRSGSFSNLQEDELEKLRQTKLQTIIDFRSDFEIQRDPDHIPSGMEVEWINSPIGNLDGKGMAKFSQVLMSPEFDEESVDELMIEANRGFVQNIKDFQPLFNALENEDAIVLFHCSAGKDRTGFASSLLLHALGADWDIIMEDFLRSNEAVEKTDLSKMEAYGIPKERVKVIMGVKPEYLLAAWDEIEKKYGDADTMLEKELGINEAKKERLRNILLTTD